MFYRLQVLRMNHSIENNAATSQPHICDGFDLVESSRHHKTVFDVNPHCKRLHLRGRICPVV